MVYTKDVYCNNNSKIDINEHLEKAGLPMNKLNKLLHMVEEQLTCDKECQREKLLQKYKKSWIDAVNNYDNLSNEIEKYEKEYIVLDKGQAYYDELLQQKYREMVTIYKDAELINLYEVKNNLDGLLIDKNTLNIYNKQIKKMYEQLLIQNKKLKLQIDKEKNKISKDERKVYYENEDLKSLSNIKFYLYILYWAILPILFVVYILVGPFFPRKEYKNYISLIILLTIYILFAIPSVLRFFSRKIVCMYYKIVHFLDFQ